jgi:hypothetical protein
MPYILEVCFMKPIRRPRICVETLEERNCPSLSAFFDGSTLTIRGMPHPNSEYASPGVGGLQVQGKGADEVQVTDGTAEIGIFAAESVNLQLANHIGSTITVDLNANVLSGNLSIGLGGGNGGNAAVSAITVGTGILNGIVEGNIQVTGGSGNEFLGLGETSQAFPTFGNLTVGGNVSFSGRQSTPVANGIYTGNYLDTGSQFPASTQAVTIGGSLLTNAIGTVDVTGPFGAVTAKTTVGGNFIANGGGNPFEFLGGTGGGGILMFGSVEGNVSVNGSPGSSGDVVSMGGANTTALVGGNIAINLGNGPDSVFLDVATVGGSVSVNTGNGSNTITTGDFAMNVGGNLSINMGNGSNSFTDDNAAVTGIAANVTVEGNLGVNLGNGANTIGAVSSSIYGNLNVNVGNGTDSMTLDGTTGAVVNGTFNYTGGNGGNSVTIDNASTNNITMNVRFGNLPANLFTIAAGTTEGTLSGSIAWSVPTLASATNGYVDNGYAWTNAVQLINIPS